MHTAAYSGKRVLITGGLGFLGSNLAHRLVGLGSAVTVVDNVAPLYGGNPYNVKDIEGSISTVIGDVRDEALLRPMVEAADVIFHFAGQVSYIDSLSMAREDLDLNAGTTLSLLEACRRDNPRATLLFASSRMVLGRVEAGQTREDVCPNPLSLYGVHKLTSEHYLRLYHENFGMPTVSMRITNPYGPRQQMKHDKYSLVGWFIRVAMEGGTIKIFDEGRQLRDYIFVDDIVDGFLHCGACPDAHGSVVNLGSGTGVAFKDMVSMVVSTVGQGHIENVPWPDAYERVETGDVVADISRLRELTGWSPSVTLSEGIRRTHEYYVDHIRHYI